MSDPVRRGRAGEGAGAQVKPRIGILEFIVFGLCLMPPFFAWFGSVVDRRDNNVPFILTFFAACALNCLLQCFLSAFLRRRSDTGLLNPEAWANSFWLALAFGPALVVLLLIVSPPVRDVGLLGQAGDNNWELLYPWMAGGAMVSLLIALIGLVVLFPLGYFFIALTPSGVFSRMRRRNSLPKTRVQTLCMAMIVPLVFVISISIAAATGFSYVSGERHYAGVAVLLRFLTFQGPPVWTVGAWLSIFCFIALIVIYARSGEKIDKDAPRHDESSPRRS